MKMTAFFLFLLLTGCTFSPDTNDSLRDFPTHNESFNESINPLPEFEDSGRETPLASQ